MPLRPAGAPARRGERSRQARDRSRVQQLVDRQRDRPAGHELHSPGARRDRGNVRARHRRHGPGGPARGRVPDWNRDLDRLESALARAAPVHGGNPGAGHDDRRSERHRPLRDGQRRQRRRVVRSGTHLHQQRHPSLGPERRARDHLAQPGDPDQQRHHGDRQRFPGGPGDDLRRPHRLLWWGAQEQGNHHPGRVARDRPAHRADGGPGTHRGEDRHARESGNGSPRAPEARRSSNRARSSRTTTRPSGTPPSPSPVGSSGAIGAPPAPRSSSRAWSSRTQATGSTAPSVRS